MRSKQKKAGDFYDEHVRLACATFGISVLVFIIIYMFDKLDTASLLGLVNAQNSKKWLEFTVNYFGMVSSAFIGFIGAIMAVNLTLKKESEFRKETSRKNVMPLIKIKMSSIGIDEKTSVAIESPDKKRRTVLSIPLSFKNVGQREMYDVWVGGVKCGSEESGKYRKIAPIIYKNDSYSNRIESAINERRQSNDVKISFKVYFRDCYENWYYQEIIGNGFNNHGKNCSIDTFEIKSAPVLISEIKLPEAIKNK